MSFLFFSSISFNLSSFVLISVCFCQWSSVSHLNHLVLTPPQQLMVRSIPLTWPPSHHVASPASGPPRVSHPRTLLPLLLSCHRQTEPNLEYYTKSSTREELFSLIKPSPRFSRWLSIFRLSSRARRSDVPWALRPVGRR